MKQPVVLVICDGLGWREEKEHNAIAAAKTPYFDRFWREYPHTLLAASGESIGLPNGQMGTSEANHLVIGSGRIIYHNLVKINNAVRDHGLSENEAIRRAMEHVLKNDSTLHIKGILGPGGVHGHTEHIKALVKRAKAMGISKILLHLFTDGRDTPPKSALEYLEDLEQFLRELGVGRIATIGGRFWGMDRDSNHDRIEKHFEAMVSGVGPKFKSAREVVAHAYEAGLTDEVHRAVAH